MIPQILILLGLLGVIPEAHSDEVPFARLVHDQNFYSDVKDFLEFHRSDYENFCREKGYEPKSPLHQEDLELARLSFEWGYFSCADLSQKARDYYIKPGEFYKELSKVVGVESVDRRAKKLFGDLSSPKAEGSSPVPNPPTEEMLTKAFGPHIQNVRAFMWILSMKFASEKRNPAWEIRNIMDIRGDEHTAYSREMISYVTRPDMRDGIHRLYLLLQTELKQTANSPTKVTGNLNLFSLALQAMGGDYEKAMTVVGALLDNNVAGHFGALNFFKQTNSFKREFLRPLRELKEITPMALLIGERGMSVHNGQEVFGHPLQAHSPNRSMYHFWNPAYLAFKLRQRGFTEAVARKAAIALDEQYEDGYWLSRAAALPIDPSQWNAKEISDDRKMILGDLKTKIKTDPDRLDIYAGAEFGIQAYQKYRP